MLSFIKEIAADGGEWFYVSGDNLSSELSVSPDAIREMRNWIKDCEWSDLDSDCEELDSVDILFGVNRHYDGGIAAFLETL